MTTRASLIGLMYGLTVIASIVIQANAAHAGTSKLAWEIAAQAVFIVPLIISIFIFRRYRRVKAIPIHER